MLRKYGAHAKRRRGRVSARGVKPLVATLEERTLLSTATVTSLELSGSALTYGQTELFTATVTTNPPSSTTPSGGTVSFMDGLTTLTTEALSAGSATFSTTGLGAGAHVVTAVYSGDAAFGGSQSGTSSASVITTEAGGGLGDGGPATAAPVNTPFGVAIDSGGDEFIADSGNNEIREVNGTTGVITTVAGTGVAGYSGDGGPATSAELDSPAGISLDSFGHLFIADSDNNVVREVNLSTGVISTVAGTGTAGFGGNGGPATSATLFGPTSVAVDSSGNLFIADTGNDVIREVSAATGKISTVAGDGQNGFGGDGGPATSAEMNFPMGVAVDSLGDLFIADSFNNRVREVSAATGTITTIAGTGVAGDSGNGGLATAAELNHPGGLTVSSSGSLLFIADSNSNAIRKVNLSAATITQVAGNGTAGDSGNGGLATAAELDVPTAVALDSSGNLFIADANNNVIRELSAATGNIATVAGNGLARFYGDGVAATLAALHSPTSVAVDSSADVFIADALNQEVREVSATTGDITTIAGTGIAGYSGDGGPASSAELDDPTGVALDSSGDIFIADSGNNVIREVNIATGVITTIAGNGIAGFSGDGGAATSAELDDPHAVALDSAGDVFIADTTNQVIREVSAATHEITTVAGQPGLASYTGDGGAATSAGLNLPEGVAVDSEGNIFIADTGNSVIRKVSAASGEISTVAGTGGTGLTGNGGSATAALLNAPTGVAVDLAGNLFIADSNNNEIREVSAATGKITAVAGNGVAGYQGDGGPPGSALLDQPTGVAVDLSGNVYIADRLNSVIREVPTTLVGQDVAVSRAPLSITAANATKTYGQSFTFGGNAFTTSTLYNGDTVTSVSLSSLGAAASAAVTGSPYSVIPSAALGSGLGNYTISYDDGGLTVNPAPLSITAANATKTYGQLFALASTEFTTSALYNGDTVTSVSLSSLGAAASAAVGGSPYSIIPSAALGSGLGNYTITYDDGSLTVNRAPLSITAVSAPMVAGQAVPVLTASFSGFENGDSAVNLTSQPVLTTAATSASAPGVYAIDVSGAASPNYTITFVNGTITVTPSTVNNSSPPPTVVGESVVITQKMNKKGKKSGKLTLSGYTITFSTAMDQTALFTQANYAVDVKSITTQPSTKGKKAGKTKVTVLTPIGFSVSNVTSNSVTLSLLGKQTFPKGGQITVLASGVDSAAHVFMTANAVLTISPKGKAIS